MKVVALISGGKDSCYNMMQCVAEGHTIVALANLKPKNKDELDSFMYQSVGHHAIDLYAEAMGLPLYRREISGTSHVTGRDYTPTPQDEVEDLFTLLNTVKEELGVEGVSVGAILSNYQRVRVENVCERLGLTSLAYLWRRDQVELLDEMIQCHVHAVLIKVAAMGLKPDKHLRKSLSEMQDYLLQKREEYDLNVCGEGGEYETFTLDCPLFRKSIVLDEVEMVLHSDDAFAPVGYLNIRKAHLEDKNLPDVSHSELIKDLPMKRSRDLLSDLFPDSSENSPCVECETLRTQQPYTVPYQSVQPKITVRPDIHCAYVSHLYLTGLVAYNTDDTDIPTQARGLMDRLKELVTTNGWSMADLVFIHLYVRDLDNFAQINTVYKSYFGINPPARACVQTVLADNVTMMVDCYGYRDSRPGCHGNRETMHVQGLSHWAPANIGPYSQCVQVGSRLFVAGTVPLVPASLEVVSGGVRCQARLSLRSVERVLAAMASETGLHSVVSMVCYVTHSQCIPVAQEELGRLTEGLACTPVYVVVPRLPKGVCIEWQVVAYNHPVPQQTVRRDVHREGNLQCTSVLTCSQPFEEDVSETTDTPFASHTACVYEEAVSQPPDAQTAVGLLRQGTSPGTPGVRRIFYPAHLFSHELLHKAVQCTFSSEDEHVVLVPVVALETDTMVLAMTTLT